MGGGRLDEVGRDRCGVERRNEKTDYKVGFFWIWCPEGDSNSHSFRKRILNPPRLPIPPSGLVAAEYREGLTVGQSAFMVNFSAFG